MRLLQVCTERRFEELFDNRSFNHAEKTEGFEKEFELATDLVGIILEKYVGAESFKLHQSYNNTSRFIDIAFLTEGYLNASLILDLQKSLSGMAEEWMVCLWESCFIFVTPKDIIGFDPSKADPLFEKLKEWTDDDHG